MKKIKLPEWCVQGVEDTFTLEKAELIIQQQKEEIRKLNNRIAYMKFDSLPEDEKKWANLAFALFTGEMYGKEYDEFRVNYVKMIEVQDNDELPF
jgi:hypothetical protein